MSAATKAAIAAERFRNMATEDEMLAVISDLVALKGGRLWHLRDARRAPELEDLPDVIAICDNKVLLIELKSARRKVTPGQQRVADMLDQCDALIVGVFRPWQLDDLLEGLNTP